jgi:hypothetical protein
MKKNLRKCPRQISDKLILLPDNEIVVGVLFKITDADVQSGKFRDIGIRSIEGALDIPQSYLPSASSGKYSERNANGYTIIRKDLGLISSVSYEMPIWGDWDNGSFTMTRPCYQREVVPATRLNIIFQRIHALESVQGQYFIFARIDEVLQKDSTTITQRLLFDLNLLQENIGGVDVYPVDPELEDFLNSTLVDWKILPTGTLDHDLPIVMSRFSKFPQEVRDLIEMRMRVIIRLNPRNWI